MTLKCSSRRRLWVSTTSTNRTRKVAVATVKKSNAIRSGAWFFNLLPENWSMRHESRLG